MSIESTYKAGAIVTDKSGRQRKILSVARGSIEYRQRRSASQEWEPESRWCWTSTLRSWASRARKLDSIDATAGIALGIADLLDLEKRVSADDHGKVQNHRIALEMAQRDVLAIVGRMKA